MAWIESHEEIGDHKKTGWLSQRLGCDVPTAVGYVHLLWHYTLKVAWRDGDLSDFTPPIIERACWWKGASGALIDALHGAGYMEKMKVHDWKEYAKHIIYQRLYNEKRRKESPPFPTDLKQSQNRKSTDVRTAATLPNLTKPLKTYVHPNTGFTEFWTHYPRKTAKATAYKAWLRLNPSTALAAEILAALRNHIKNVEWEKDDGRFIPHAATWLNQKRWEDEIKSEKTEIIL